jgi:mannosyltransferase OCH1-like enzyme/Tfp pilus assembly protein PilF
VAPHNPLEKRSLPDIGELDAPIGAVEPDRLLELGQRARAQGERDRALELFRRVLASHPIHVRATFATAETLRELTRFDEAERCYRRVLELSPKNAGALLALGRIARRRGDRAAALEHFQAALVTNPAHVQAALEAVAELQLAGQFAQACQLLDTLVESRPRDARVLIALGKLERARGNREAASVTFAQACAAQPDRSDVLIELAIEQRVLGHPDAALDTARRALQLEPASAGALLEIAQHAAFADDIEAAAMICRQAIAVGSQRPAPYLHASRLLFSLGRRAEAFAVLDEAVSRFGRRPDLTMLRIGLLSQAGQIEAADELARCCCNEGLLSFPLWAQKTRIAIVRGHFAEAADALRDPPADAPSERAAAARLRAQLAEVQWQFAEAAEHLRQAIAEDDSDPTRRMELARVCVNLLRLDEAADHLRASRRLAASTLKHRGQSHNISQTAVGQLRDEFRLDLETLARVTDVAKLPPAQQLLPLRQMIRQNPAPSLPALRLLLALRLEGAFTRPHAAADHGAVPPAIPRRIAQYWDQAEPPADVADIMLSWALLHPDLTYWRFDDHAARLFLIDHFPPEVLTAYQRATVPAQKADIFRLAWLYAEGGFYADADDRAVAHLDKVVPPDVTFVAWQEECGSLGNNFLGSVPGNPVIGRALDRAVKAINIGDTDIVWLSSGPALLARAFAQVLAECEYTAEMFLRQCLILERWSLGRFVGIHSLTSYKAQGKHWLRTAFGRRRSDKVDWLALVA